MIFLSTWYGMDDLVVEGKASSAKMMRYSIRSMSTMYLVEHLVCPDRGPRHLAIFLRISENDT